MLFVVFWWFLLLAFLEKPLKGLWFILSRDLEGKSA